MDFSSRSGRRAPGTPNNVGRCHPERKKEVLLSDIDSSIEVSIQAVPTFTTKEEALRSTIVSGLMPTFGAGLRGMARINLDHLDPSRLRFVLDKGV